MDDETIREKMFELAEEYDVDPIVARSFGSHMMNLDSEGSDYDVFFLFAQRAADYAAVGGYQDTIDRKFGDDLDFQGWNVKKFGELLNDSNPTAMEFLNSPVEYFILAGVDNELESLREMANTCFKPISVYHHYRSMAESNYHKYIERSIYDNDGSSFPIVGENDHCWVVSGADDGTKRIRKDASEYEEAETDRTAKRYLYIMRAVCSAKYVRHTGRFPTMDFPDFLAEIASADWLDEETYAGIGDLVAKKKRGEALQTVGNPHEEFITNEFQYEYGKPKYDREMRTEQINDFIESCTQ